MKETLLAKQKVLREEYNKGEQMLKDLDHKRLELERTMLQITGAIQVIDELLMAEEGNASDATSKVSIGSAA